MQKKNDSDKLLYTARMEYSQDTIRKLAEMQYNTFSFGRKMGQAIASVLLILMGMFMGSTIGVIAMAVGCFLIVSLNLRPRNTADQICRSLNGKYPKLTYAFYNDGVGTDQVPEPVSYDKFIRLIDDGSYLYMYVSNATAFMVDKSSVKGGTVQELSDTVAVKTGLKWRKPNSLLSLRLSTLREAFFPGSTAGDQGFSGYRLDDHR